MTCNLTHTVPITCNLTRMRDGCECTRERTFSDSRVLAVLCVSYFTFTCTRTPRKCSQCCARVISHSHALVPLASARSALESFTQVEVSRFHFSKLCHYYYCRRKASSYAYAVLCVDSCLPHQLPTDRSLSLSLEGSQLPTVGRNKMFP